MKKKTQKLLRLNRETLLQLGSIAGGRTIDSACVGTCASACFACGSVEGCTITGPVYCSNHPDCPASYAVC